MTKVLADNRWGAAPAMSHVLYAATPGVQSSGGMALLAKTAPDAWLKRVEEAKKTYEREYRELNILLFPEILQRTTSFCFR